MKKMVSNNLQWLSKDGNYSMMRIGLFILCILGGFQLIIQLSLTSLKAIATSPYRKPTSWKNHFSNHPSQNLSLHHANNIMYGFSKLWQNMQKFQTFFNEAQKL